MVESFTMTDGVTVACHRDLAQGECRGRIVFVHGIRSHAGWYEATRRDLAVAGFEVVFPDRRGAGTNSENRGDCPSFRRLLDDVIEVIESEKKKGEPVYVVGVSWGGKLAISLPYRKPGVVDGIVLIAPGIVPRVSPSLVDRVRIFFSRLINPTRLFPIPLNDPKLFTSSPEGQQFIEHDPLGLRQATARFLFNSAQLDLYIRRALKHVTCPVLLLSAGRDQIADPIRSRDRLQAKLKRLTEVNFPDREHTLEFEAVREKTIAEIVKFFSFTPPSRS